jgi:hypothetical protein
MIPDTFIEVLQDGVYLNGEKVPNLADFQQECTEILHNPIFSLIIADAKCRAYQDGFLNSTKWESTLASKGWFGCAANIETLLKKIIDFREPMV